MRTWVRDRFVSAYERLLRREIDDAPKHVAIIQDGNRRYARSNGEDPSKGHRAGADTTERVLDWCADLDIEEATLYAFSTENFNRPDEELEPLFDLLESKLYEFADVERIHDDEVRIRAIGEIDRLPERVQSAVEYAESRTAGYETFRLNIALAYGGRNELLRVTREIAAEVGSGELDPGAIDPEEIERRLYGQELREVDLIIRTGGDERTSNFLPWHANGNEAAVYFCTPYWPEFSKIDFLRGIRTYQSREASWQRARTERAIAILRAVAATELDEARSVATRLRQRFPEIGASIEQFAGESAESGRELPADDRSPEPIE